MSANFGGNLSQDVDVNITPIIDCFTVLITFLLASASFLSIGFFEAATPGVSGSSSPTLPTSELVVRVTDLNQIELVEKGKERGKYHFDLSTETGEKALDQELMRVAQATPNQARILLTAKDSVAFDSLARVMGHLNRTSFPIIIGDFKEEP
jgi:biopolymer transport protein ExbD